MSLIIRTDVTAVKLFQDKLLAGIGSHVHVYDNNSKQCFQRLRILNGQKIYGFVPSHEKRQILVFGGKQFSVLALDGMENFITSFQPIKCDDWIHSGVWINTESIALLTAHNVVQIWNITTQTLVSTHASPDNSILYSGLLLPLCDEQLLVFAGTVFSEVIIHHTGSNETLHRLKGHRGVIFSIACDSAKGVIVTTSDDRSVRIWNVINQSGSPNTSIYWKNAEIVCKHEVYGHTARVMRSCITESNIVSVGEDSLICFWDLDGSLVRKLEAHQNGGIWSVDSDKEHLATGGGDCGVMLHPLSLTTDYGIPKPIEYNIGGPKKIAFTSRRNLIILDDKNLYYHDFSLRSDEVYKLEHDSTYKLLSVSSCKQIIAVADMLGKLDVFVENCKGSSYLLKIVDTKLNIGNILSMHWAGNRHLVLCSENGAITVLATKGNLTEVYANFVLPKGKERWLTASAMDSTRSVFILGDRCGNVHIFVKGELNPIKTFNKVHGRYGPTSINIKCNEIATTGRDGTVRYFTTNSGLTQFKYMSSRDMGFQWVEKFLDSNQSIICGFQERVFVVADVKTKSKLIEVPCGGGHRSWDAIRYIAKENEDYEEFVKLVFIKNSEINLATFRMEKIVSKNVVNGSHSKEINCLKVLNSDLDRSTLLYISGGEDTTLRVSSASELSFEDEIVYKHLSNIRTLKLCNLENNTVLILSAGGRAQISVNMIQFTKTDKTYIFKSQELINYLIRGTDKERKGNQTWRNCTVDFNPETRIMDLDYVKVDNNVLIVFTGCSDAFIRVFRLNYESDKALLKPIKDIEHPNCILKINCIKVLDKYLIVTCTTRGLITFFELKMNSEVIDLEPTLTVTANKSGINSIDMRLLSNERLLVATGGDDNAVYLNLLDIPDINDLKSMKVLHSYSTATLHCSQITGLILLENYMITASIDQRISVCSIVVSDEGIQCEFVSQTYSDTADIQGMEVVDKSSDTIRVCVFGKGMEVVELSIAREARS